MNSFQFPAEPDFNGWAEAVQIVVDQHDLDYYPSEELVAQAVEDYENNEVVIADPSNPLDLDEVAYFIAQALGL